MKKSLMNVALGLAILAGGCSATPPQVAQEADAKVEDATQEPDQGTWSPSVKVATFNTSLYRDTAGGLASDLATGEDAQAKRVAEVLQKVRPDIVLLNEFDWDAEGASLADFREKYLEVSQNGGEPIAYEFGWVFRSNTGVHSGHDLDNDGQVSAEPGSRAYGGDAFGYGTFEGQYAFAVLSKFDRAAEPREFREFLWKDLPDHRIPTEWYDAEEQDVFRLSSKNHVDLTLSVHGRELHLLASHPTPPSFDGPEDRNGRRNGDEVRFWNQYISGASFADDAGNASSLGADANFVIVGDLNVDPHDGDAYNAEIQRLLAHERVASVEPKSAGAVEAANAQGGANTQHTGDAAMDTADFSDGAVGNLRVDYALPSKTMQVIGTGVFWPAPDEEGAELADVSDHHLVWVDVELP